MLLTIRENYKIFYKNCLICLRICERYWKCIYIHIWALLHSKIQCPNTSSKIYPLFRTVVNNGILRLLRKSSNRSPLSLFRFLSVLDACNRQLEKNRKLWILNFSSKAFCFQCTNLFIFLLWCVCSKSTKIYQKRKFLYIRIAKNSVLTETSGCCAAPGSVL